MNAKRAFRAFFVYCLLFSVLRFRLTWADSPQDLFKQGNAVYAQGDFPKAISLYESARDGGLRSWALFFNLGNAFYKNNQLGKAILNYEKAFRLSSSDGDLIYNLNLVSTKAGDPLVPASGLAALCWRVFYWISLNSLTLIVSLVLILLSIYLILGFLGKRPLSWNLVSRMTVVLIFFGTWLGIRIYFAERAEGVIVTPTADVRSGPNLTYPANFTIPEGRTVLLLDEQEPVTGWVEIGVPQEGLKGWVPTSSIEVL